MSDMLEEALTVARDLGLPVFPCCEKPTAKKPVSKKPYTPHGYKDASKNEEQIRRWWAKHPQALIGVPTGQKSGIFVVDIDQSEKKDGES